MSKLILSSLIVCGLASAEMKRTSTLKASATEGVTATGEFEIKPSWEPSASRVYLLNHAELGARFGKRGSVSYQQEFTTDISQEEPSGRAPLYLNDGFFRGRWNELWKTRDGRSAILSAESRIYLPTDSSQADKGLIFAIRNYFKLTHLSGRGFSLTFMEVPIHYFYSEDGTVTPSDNYWVADKASANPTFENRVYVVMGYDTPDGKVSFVLPALWSVKKYRDFLPIADNNDSWTHVILFNPELTYGVSRNVRFGIEYESDNVLNLQSASDPDSQTTMGSGVFRLILRAGF